jgi:hypothetical protein
MAFCPVILGQHWISSDLLIFMLQIGLFLGVTDLLAEERCHWQQTDILSGQRSRND